MNKEAIGERIKAIMKERGITQMALSEKVGISQSNISAMLNGKRDTLRLAETFSEAYNIELDYLILNKEKERQAINDINMSSEYINYITRSMELFDKYMENEQRYQELIKENHEIMKQIIAIHKLIKEEQI